MKVKNKMSTKTKPRRTRSTRRTKKKSNDSTTYKSSKSLSSKSGSTKRSKKQKSESKKDDLDLDIDSLIIKLSSLEEEISDQKKIKEYKPYLNNLNKKINRLIKSNKYEEAIDELNEEIKKTNDRYLRNEMLKIADNIKYDNYDEKRKGNQDLNFPSYYDSNFSSKIFKKAEFYKSKLEKVKPDDVESIIQQRKSGEISLAKHQRFLKNFMSRRTPYNSLLIFHGMGVGKTCASIAIAESLKPSILEQNQKINIIAKSHFDKGEIFSMDRFKKNQNQCASNDYVEALKNPELIRKCKDGNSEACRIMKHKIDKQIKKIYNFYGALEWAKKVLREIQKSLRGVPEEKHQQTEIAKIKKMFNNSVLIIDEAHNIKDISEKKSRIVPPVLMKVLEHADNLKLVLLTGTPMFNEPSDLISIINYLLINEGRGILKESDIFNKDGTFTKTGKDTLIKYSRGFVSFLRSENPITYPIRLSASINGTKDIISKKNYPKYDIHGNPLNDHIKHLEIVDCPMSQQQEKVYKTYLEKRLTPEDEKTSAAYSSELQILNFIYQDMNETSNVNEAYGEKGLNSVMKKTPGKAQYQFIEPKHALRLKGEKLGIYSSKIHKIIENIKKAKGTVFVYTEYENSGILPLVFALELAGYQKYRSSETPVLLSDHKNKKYQGDYLIISGNTQLSKYHESYLAKRHDMIKEPVKVILATRKASEGISFFGIREIHILNPWHNLNRLSQAIGRGLRSYSHISLPAEERNVTVYIYAATYKNQETVDLKIYREAENKAINIGLVEDVLRRNAIDCPLNKDGNYYSKKDWGKPATVKTSRGDVKKIYLYDQPYSHVCHYMKDCDYKCYGNLESRDLKPDEIDYSTYDLDTLKYEINEVVKEIQKIFNKSQQVVFSLNDIISKIPDKHKTNQSIVYKALDNMVENKTTVKDKYNREGYIIYRGTYYIYQPSDIMNMELLTYQREFPPPIRPNMVDLSEYVNKMASEKKKLVKKDQYKYSEVITYIDYQFTQIKEKQSDAIFQSSFDLDDKEIYQIIGDRLINSFKIVALKTVLEKAIKKEKLNKPENILMDVLKSNIIYQKDIDLSNSKQIYGFRLVENGNLVFYSYNSDQKDFIIDEGSQLKILDIYKIRNQRDKKPKDNKIYGYLKFDKPDVLPLFKIRDTSKGDKKSIKGITCVFNSRKEIFTYLKNVEPKSKEISNKKVMCDDIEVILRRNNDKNKDGNIWFYNSEDFAEKEILEKEN